MVSRGAVIGGGTVAATLAIAVIIAIIVFVLLRQPSPSPVPGAQVQTPATSSDQEPDPPTDPPPLDPPPNPFTPYSGPQSSLSIAPPPPDPIIQQIGLTAPPAEQGQVAAFLDGLPDLLTTVGIGLLIEAVLRADMIAYNIMTRIRMTPAIEMELKAARARVKAKTLSGRMSKAFGRMGTLARAKMGLRWGKTMTQAGETVDSSTVRLLAEAAQANIDSGARLAATQIAERQAAGAALKSVGLVFDVAAIVGLALDMTNTGNYTELVSTADMRTMKVANESEVVNTTIACSSWPLGIACPPPPATPAAAPVPAPGPDPAPRPGRYPMFVGPLDAVDTETLDSAISDEFARIFTSENPPQSVKDLVADVSSRISADFGVESIDNDTFQLVWNQYMTPVELDNLHDMAFDTVCISEGGVAFVPGNGYDKTCSYATKDSCHAAYPWPPPQNDDEDLTYTEWRAKPWFSSGDWTNTITQANIPANGACIAADPSIHQMCDEEVGTGTGRATNDYIRETGQCVNSREMCRIKGVSYRNSDPPTCYIADGQELAELIFGSTIVRFIVSGGKLSLDPDLITTVVTVTIPPVNSGNSTVDTAVDTVSSGLASAAAEISNAGIIAANEIQKGLVDATNELVNGVADVIRDAIPVVVEIADFVMDFDRAPLVVTDPITAELTVNVPTVSTGSAELNTAVNAVSSGLASTAAEISNAGIAAANALQTEAALAVNTVVDIAADIVAGTIVVVLPALADVGTQVFVQTAGTQGSTVSAALSGSAAAAVEQLSGGTQAAYVNSMNEVVCSWNNGGYTDGKCYKCPAGQTPSAVYGAYDAGLQSYPITSYNCVPLPPPPPRTPYPWEHPATPTPPGVQTASLPVETSTVSGTQSCPSGSVNSGFGCYNGYCGANTPCLTCPSGQTLSSDNAWCYTCPSDAPWRNSTNGCVKSSLPVTVTTSSTAQPATWTGSTPSCPSGYSLNEAQAYYCYACPTGQVLFLDDGFITKCKSCPSGYSLSSDQSYCIKSCPANSVYDTSINDCRCAPGFIKSTDGLSCISLSCSGRTSLQL